MYYSLKNNHHELEPLAKDGKGEHVHDLDTLFYDVINECFPHATPHKSC